MKNKYIFPILIIIISLLALGFTQYSSVPGCDHVAGRLYNGQAKMVGGISGDYYIDFPGFCATDTIDSVTRNCNTSRVEGKNGTIYFKEYSVLDFTETQGTNGAVLMVIQGGTGDWEGASGHIVLSGYFHLSDMLGEWYYQGEVCTP